MLLAPAQIKLQSFEKRQYFFFLSFFNPGGRASCLHPCLDATLLPHSYYYPNLLEGARQLRGYKECPFSGVAQELCESRRGHPKVNMVLNVHRNRTAY